jgi:ABC-type multidrug transport system fused ATPase/permease subunit
LFFVLMFSFSKILLGWWISLWSGDKLQWDLSQYVWGYIILSLIHSFLLPIHKVTFISGGMSAMWKIHTQMISSVLSAPMSFFERTPMGEVLNRFMDDVMKLDYQIPSFFISFFGFLFNSLLTIAMIIIITPPSFFFILIVGCLFVFVWYLGRKPQLFIQQCTEASRDPISSHISSSINGLMTIQAYENQYIFANEFVKRLDYHCRSRWLEIILFRWLTLRLEVLAHTIVFACAIFCVLMGTRISPDIAALALTYSLTISDQFNSAMNVFMSAEGGMFSFNRCKEFTHLENEFSGKPTKEQAFNWPNEGKIEFHNVKLKYEEYLGLNDVTVTFGPGEVIGILGKPGSGRTSIFVSLFRLIELADGKILIDGVDISQVDLQHLRPKLSIIPQEHLLLSGTLRNNIDPIGKFSDYLITMALDSVHLKRKLDKLEITLDDSVEVLQKLSFGEKQLIAVARCVLYDSKVIMIDDALQNVESKTKRRIEEIICGFKGKTVLIVAPKNDSILECCTRVMVMGKGTILEYDTLEKLKANKDSEYNKMK